MQNGTMAHLKTVYGRPVGNHWSKPSIACNSLTTLLSATTKTVPDRQAGISTEAKAAKRKMQDDLLKYCFQSVAIETSSVYGKSSPCFEQLCKETC